MTANATVGAADGVRIAYRFHPGSEPVLLVHGFAASAQRNWEDTGWLRMFNRAGRGTISPDLRGHGESGKPHDPADYTPAAFGDDLRRVLDDAGLDRVAIVTYSMGGRAALEFTEHHPQRVSRLVLGGLGGRELFATIDEQELRAALLDGNTAGSSSIVATFAAAAGMPGNDPKALYACATGMRGAPALQTAPPVPTLLLAGDADPVAADAPELAGRMGLAYTAIPGRGHLNAISARAGREAALAFLSEPRVAPREARGHRITNGDP